MSAREVSIAFQTDKTPAQYVRLARLVNQYAFNRVSVYCDAPFHPSFGPLLLMAPRIERAQIGPAAVSPSRIHPIDIAAEMALLSQVAPGGVYLGLARGAWLADHGITELTPPVQAIRETVEVIRYLLSGMSGGYSGRIFQLAAHVKAPYPVPEHPIPIMIGTWGAKMAALAGEIADEVKVGGSANPALVPVMRESIAQGELKASRPVGSVAITMGAVTVVDEDREAARTAARRAAALYLPVVAPLDSTLQIEPELIQRLAYNIQRENFTEAVGLISDDLLERFAFCGNAHDIIRQANQLFDTGAQRVEFGTPHGLNAEMGISLLGEQVLPALQAWLRA